MATSFQLILSLILIQGYVGKNCDKFHVDCDTSAPCLNGGLCVVGSAAGDYTCNCGSAPGFTGPNCEDNIDECEG